MPENPNPPEFDPTALSDTDLHAEYERIRTRGQELRAQENMSEDETRELTELAARLSPVNAELDAREQRRQEVASAADAFATLAPRPAPAAAPVSEPVSAPVAAQEPAPAPAAPAEPAQGVQAASVPSVATIPAQEPVPAPVSRRTDTFGMHLTSDGAAVLGRNSGDDASLHEIAQATGRLFSQFGTSGARRDGVKAERALAQFTRDRGAELTLPTRPDADAEMAVVNFARNERRLDGGSLLNAWSSQVKELGDGPNSLTAAAGWCAPSENRYELCNLWSTDGILDLPTTTAPRGGINYTTAVSWAAINDAAITSFTKLTEAQVIADTEKNCTELPCPTFTDRRLDVAVTCITGSFLQAAGFPEVVSTWTDGLLTRHAHEINEDVIAQIVTQAGAANVIAAQGAGGTGTTADTSAASSILSAVELAAEDMRYRSRMPFATTFEVVLPHWILPVLRADIARKNAWHADPYALANATIVSWFTTRGIRPQFVYGWQDQQSGLATGPGDITAPIAPILSFPTTVNFLIYPAGAVVLARQDVVTLTNVYDSTNLRQNLYTALFTEEAYAPIFPCGEVRQYTAQACPSGATGHQVYTSCAAPAA